MIDQPKLVERLSETSHRKTYTKSHKREHIGHVFCPPPCTRLSVSILHVSDRPMCAWQCLATDDNDSNASFNCLIITLTVDTGTKPFTMDIIVFDVNTLCICLIFFNGFGILSNQKYGYCRFRNYNQ